MSVQEKAHRLLCASRVRVVEVASGRPALARVAGDHGDYVVTVDHAGATCSCPAFTRRCSHTFAVSLIVEDAA